MHVVIVGGGRTGSHLAGLLLAGGHRVRVVEHREETVAKLLLELPAETVVAGDGGDPKMRVAAIVTGAEERIEEGAPAAGKAIRDLAIPAGCTIAAIVRGKNVLAPRGDTVLLPGDEVIAVVRAAQAAELARLLRRP